MRFSNALRTLAFLGFACSPVLGEEIRDYYAEPGINPFKETINDSFNEQVDPFSGTLQLKYTDLFIPGNGGMDVRITRTYTSLQTNAYPTLNQNGLGWTMHFGRVVISRNHLGKLCNQASFPLTTKENPSLELPDGGREILALSSSHTNGTLITRSNWIARCTGASAMEVTAPDGTRYTMDRFDNFQEEPALLATRIEDVHGNWIAIDYAQNSLGINYVTQIRRSEDGVVATFQYEDLNTQGIAISSIIAGNQTVVYEYDPIPGFMLANYKQLVRATRPDGRSWEYSYNPKMPDPNPNDDIPEDGMASYSLVSVTYPFGAHIAYAYQYVTFDPGAPADRTTSIHSKTVSGGGVTPGIWTYQFAPHSTPYDDGQGGQLRYDVTTVTAPEAIYVYKHYGKDFRSGGPGVMFFTRPSFVGLLNLKETWSRGPGSRLLERVANSWGQRKISNEDYWHGAGYRDWWRDDGTYAPVLAGEYVSRDNAISATYAHARLYFDFDQFGNPGRVYSHSSVTSQPSHQVLHTYYNDVTRWIIGVPDDETHQKIVDEQETTLGTIEREINVLGQVTRVVEFGEETRYTYTSTGDLHTVRDARNNLTTYGNYKRGIAQSEQRPESVSITRVVNNNGTLRSETDGRGNLTAYTYDSLHRLASIDYPIKADVSVVYENGTGSYRRVLTRSNYRQTETINDFGETVRVERRDLTSLATIVRTSSFDSFGREIFSSYPNNTIGTTTSYDALGRIQELQHPDNSFIQYEHDDVLTKVTNERGHRTEYLYAILGTAFSQDDPAAIRAPESVTTNIHRDVWGNITELFQGEQLAGNVVLGYGKTYRYDDRRLLVESYEPEVGTTTFDHDAVGNVVWEQTNDLPVVAFAFDGLNRRTRVDFSDSTPDIVTTYDQGSNIERVTKGATEWFYTYDENGNLRSERLTINHSLLSPRIYLVSRDYSDLDVLSVLTYPSGLQLSYAPDGFGRATQVGTYATNIGYHPSGALASYQLANGVTTNIALNQRLLTQSILAGGIVNLSYGYDASGNVMNINDGIDSSKNVVMNGSSYDGLDRLLHAQGHWGSSNFTYDVHGNFKTKAVGQRGMRYGVDSSRRAKQVSRYESASPTSANGAIGMEYDKRGNMTVRRSLTGVNTTNVSLDEKLFQYDSASHLIRARVNRTTASGTTAIASKDYAYDGNGYRVLEQKHGSYDIRFSVYGSGGQLLFEDLIAECTRTDHIRLGATGIAKSDDLLNSPSLDSDGDQITDCYESVLGLNPQNAADAAADADGDGLANLEEFRAGTSLSRADTDGDGLSDQVELEQHLTDANSQDTDGDGLSDAVEAANPQLDPRSADKDHDGVTDYWESRLQTNPESPDGLVDTDTDGFSNRQESGSRSNPELAATLPSRGTQIWSANLLSTIYQHATIGQDRTVYVTGDDGRLYAFWPDGTRRFVYGQPYERILPPTVGPDGAIYIVVKINGGGSQGSLRSYIRALNPDGTQRWAAGFTEYLETPVAVGEGGRLYFSGYRYRNWSDEYFVASLGSDGTGMVLRLTHTQASVAPVVSPNGDVFFAMFSRLLAFTKALEPRWEYQLRGPVSTSLSISADNTIYAGDNLGYVYALRSAGTLRWEAQVSTGSQRSAVTVAGDGSLYVGGYNSVLKSLNASDGATRWSVSTTGTTYTPALGADGTIYVTTYAGDLMAFDSNGYPVWRFNTGGRVFAAPVIDRDGTVYFGTETAQMLAVADNGGGPARTPWPMERHDSASTGNICFNERAFSLLADSDGDQIDDCAEYRYGLNPENAADGSADPDGDGLLNFEEHQHGTRIDVVDSDGDGLNDGIEVLTYHTNPAQADTDHDTIPDGAEITFGTNPLDSADVNTDYDNDGFSNRQESLAGTDPRGASSTPAAGQLARSQAPGGRNVAVARDGTIYRSNGSQLEALHPDLTRKWLVSAPSVPNGGPVIGADGSIYMVEQRNGETQRIVAYRPSGLMRWAHPVPVPNGYYGIWDKPAVGADGTLHYSYSTNALEGDRIYQLTPQGQPKPGSSVYFGRDGELAIAPNGRVAIYDSLNSLTLLSSTGARLWENRTSPVKSATDGRVVWGSDANLYVRNNIGLISVNPANGTVRWQVSNVGGWPVIDSAERVIAYCHATALRNLCAIDSTGAVVWTESTGYTFLGTPAIDASGAILVHTSNDRFVAFNGDGTVRWQTPLPVSTSFKSSDGPVVFDDATILVPATPQDYVILGTGRGLANSAWPARDRDVRASRNAGTVPPMPPSASPSIILTDPLTGLVSLDIGEPRTVRAQASDAVEGDISAAIRWSSTLAGEFATGPTASLTALAAGTHTITATVTDSETLTASTTMQLTKGAIAPTIVLHNPNYGQTFDVRQQVFFQATATDRGDGFIGHLVRWSSDRDGTIGTGPEIYRTNLSTGSHVIAAAVTDSSGLTATQTVPIEIVQMAPSITHSPYDLAELELGAPVEFFGTASDNGDGDVSDTLVWTSDRDGLLGNGQTFTISTLSVGTHVITATAEDDSGTEGSIQFTVIVRSMPPSVQIQSPNDWSYWQVGADIPFYGSAVDTTDGDLSAVIQWSSLLDGPIGTGQGYINRNDLSVGTHVITASVTDSDGLTGKQERYVTVGDPNNSAPSVYIYAPEMGSQHPETTDVTLQAEAYDYEEGYLTDIQWSSDLEGALGVGESITTSALRVGTHQIKALITDSSGAKAAHVVTIEVVPLLSSLSRLMPAGSLLSSNESMTRPKPPRKSEHATHAIASSNRFVSGGAL